MPAMEGPPGFYRSLVFGNTTPGPGDWYQTDPPCTLLIETSTTCGGLARMVIPTAGLASQNEVPRVVPVTVLMDFRMTAKDHASSSIQLGAKQHWVSAIENDSGPCLVLQGE